MMLLGTVTLVLPLDSATVTPPEGAGADKVTVQEELPGALTVPGEQLRLAGTTGTVRLTVVDWFCPFSVAVTVAVWALETVPLVAVKVALLWFAGTVTLAGTGKVPVLLVRETDVALVAALLSETVQVVVALLASDDGEHDTEVSCAGATRLSVEVGAPAPDPAVIVALWPVVTVAPTAVNPAVL